MGTKMAPSYANIFMGKLEEEFLVTQSNQPAVWWRYIDDIFTYGEEKLQQFINNLNAYHPSIKVKAEWSAAEVVFLDTTVRLKNQKIETDLYSNQLTNIYTYRGTVVTHRTVRNPSLTAKLSDSEGFAQKKMTSPKEQQI